MNRHNSSISIFLLIVTLLACLVEGTGYGHRVIRVTAGESIQRAIDKSRPGDRIHVGPGTYSEYLTISKSGLNIWGNRAVLVSPNKPPKNPNGCVGLAGNDTTAGICIIGTDVKLEPFQKEHRKVSSVGNYVEDVRVEGFQVRGFSGLNIAIVGARRTTIKNIVSVGVFGAQYGILTVGSFSTLIKENRVKASGLPFIGICMDDKSDVRVTRNTVTDYGIGLCIQTNGASVSKNKVSNCCIGAFIDPGINRTSVTDNQIGASNPLCNPAFGGFASGISIAGSNNRVKGNIISGTTDKGQPVNIAAGIAIFDQGSVATGNVVVGNVLKNNDQDILVATAGKNKITRNKCETPEELCKSQ